MYNKIQNLFQNEIEQIKWKINVLQDRLQQFKKKEFISKWAYANRKNAESFTK